MPEGFLCADAILRLAQNVTNGLHVNEKVVQKAVNDYLPFMATENLLMEAVKRGGNRQELHEIIRRCSMEATARMKNGEECGLLESLAREEQFGLSASDISKIMVPELYTGRCSAQVDRFLEKIKPLTEGVGTGSAEINL